MKIGIITNIGFFNYGNRLQNAAVEKILQDYGYETETLHIHCKESEETGGETKSKIKRLLPDPIYRLLKWGKDVCQANVLDQRRSRQFLDFSKKHTHMKELWIEKDVSEALNMDDYAWFATGSDQVWNPDFAGTDLYFLTFAESEKRIALMASVGYAELDGSVRARYADRLNQMAYISVREKSAQELVKELTGREADLIMDPTLLVDASFWLSVMERPQLDVPENYILSFFLGEEPKKEITVISKSSGLPVVHMNQKRAAEWYVLNPAHFLYMIKHADYVLTDSFHAVAFSINFNTSFYVFQRKERSLKNMFSRMETLMETFHLEDRIYAPGFDREPERVARDRWESVNRELLRQRKMADEKLDFLRERVKKRF